MTRHRPLEALIAAVLLLVAARVATAQDGGDFYVGGIAGVSALSADTTSAVSNDRFQVASYAPENGVALNLFAGVHIREYVSVQGNYLWNRNAYRLEAALGTGSFGVFEAAPADSSQHAVVADLLVYFRERRSRLRPYLSIGSGVVRFGSRPDNGMTIPSILPEAGFTRTKAVLRVAVGIDVAVGHAWHARYSFSESLSGNPIGERLEPTGSRNLANFQNLVGLVRSF